MRHKILVTLILGILIPTLSFTQNGIIRGSVKDTLTGAPIYGVKIMAAGTLFAIRSDLEGKFELQLPPGTYTLNLTGSLYNPLTLTNVVVSGGEVTLLENIPMREATNELGPVVVSVEKIENTEISLDKLRSQSVNPIDFVSSETIKKSGDGEVVGAVSRVPGMTVSGGKYVYVRGLGDRYNKTQLNGVDIPGLDPDRNSLQMDIFPTNIVDNIIVHKGFIANLPADFTGGLVDIGLKSFPEKSQGSVSLSGSYNPSFHFNAAYLTYDGGSTDFLGFDDGTRAIPAVTNIPFFSQAVGNPNGEKGLRYQEILGSFNPTLAAYKQRSFMDYGFSADYGNQIKREKFTYGFNFVLTYKNTTEFYKNAEFGRYGLSGDPNVTEMELREHQVGDYGVNNVLLTGMAGFAVKTASSRIRLMLLHVQNGESKAGIFDYLNADQGAVFGGFQHNLEYSQRSMTHVYLEGSHRFKDDSWKLEWKVSPTYSTIHDPDIRFTRYEDRDGIYTISTESGFPERIWRELQEKNLAAKIDVEKEYKIFGNEAKLKFGLAYLYKERSFVVRSFALNVRNMDLTGDPNELFAPENIWPYNGDPTKGTTFEANFVPTNPNQYDANIVNMAGYMSTEFLPTDSLRVIIGVRFENYAQRYTGQDQLGTNVLNNEKVLNNLGIFPSLNLVYAINKNQNVRFSYGKTIARPSFKELSYAEIYDPISGRTFIGGLFRDADDASGVVYWDGNLVSTDIHNFDLRYEIYNKIGASISFSAFYKKFFNPIEIVQFSAQAGSFQPRNVGDGQVLGGEVEFRQSLGMFYQKLDAFTLTFNFTYTQSRIELSETEYQSRVNNARTGQVIGEYRDMAGQAPYVINAGLYFKSPAEKGFLKGFEGGLFYNVQGRTLEYVGIVDRPDIYTNSFHSLNFNSSKTFGKDEQFQVGLKVDNILNDKKESIFMSYQATDQYFSRLSPGRTVQAKFVFKF